MALLIKRSMEFYKYLMYDIVDERMDVYPLMHTPVQIIFLLTCYTLFVFKIGPKLMESRQPYKLKEVLLGYNAVQMIANAYLFITGFPIYIKYSWQCEPIDYGYSEDSLTMTKLAWMYFMLKLIDLLDTVFFVLRKNYRQVTFLHVYHHIMMVLVGWFITKYFAGGHTCYVGIYNAFVHVFMYGYYLLSAMSDGIKANPWYKKYITQLQLFQFMLICLSYTSAILTPWCTYPKPLAFLILSQNLLMIYLFGTFYYKTYVKKPTKKV